MQALQGVLSAREFVWWYNGHPFVPGDSIDLSKVNSAVIIGVGNVALDCARVLLSSPERIQQTDIAEHALRQLRHRAIQHIHLVARRGPVQVLKVTSPLLTARVCVAVPASSTR